MADGLKIIFVFVDGLGIGSDDPAINPLFDPRLPQLQQLVSEAIPLDACLGVDGLPQSATGQTSLLTGINAPEAMGRHIEGFPPPSLKELIQRENLFSKLTALGKQPTFANCYLNVDVTQIPPRRQSVTTVMALSALGQVRGNAELELEMAVTHDITRLTMHTRGYEGPVVLPEVAAEHLLNVAQKHDFTLFEYFLTDRAGHSGNPDLAHQCLETLERFIPKVASFADQPNHLFLLCSDHGNIEDRTTFTHTRNPVPLIALGDSASAFQNLTNLADVTPATVHLYES